MMRARVSARATRDVSIVIQRRPHCSATVAVVPEPQVGPRTRSPGSVAIRRHLSTTLVEVSTIYLLSDENPATVVSDQKSEIGYAGKSSRKRTYRSVFPAAVKRRA